MRELNEIELDMVKGGSVGTTHGGVPCIQLTERRRDALPSLQLLAFGSNFAAIDGPPSIVGR